MALFVVAAACAAPPDDAPPPLEAGQLCADAKRRGECGPGGIVLACDEGRWVEVDCELQCQGAWLGCYSWAGFGMCECAAAPDDEVPNYGHDSACIDSATLLEYDGSAYIAVPCAEACAERGTESIGCFTIADEAACYCEVASAPCEDGEPPRCDGPSLFATCTDGEWTLTDCAIACAPLETNGCRLADDGAAACNCVEQASEGD